MYELIKRKMAPVLHDDGLLGLKDCGIALVSEIPHERCRVLPFHHILHEQPAISVK